MPEQNTKPVKYIFALDLDETTFATLNRLEYLDPGHHLTPLPTEYQPILTNLEKTRYSIPAWIINRAKLQSILEEASLVCDEIIILTSGCYEPDSIRNMLVNLPLLSLVAKEKLATLRVHTPITDCDYFFTEVSDYTVRKTAEIDKAERITELKTNFPELEGTWILFDDSERNIKSCENLENVYAIRATTDVAEWDCYEEVEDLLQDFNQLKMEYFEMTQELQNSADSEKPETDSSQDQIEQPITVRQQDLETVENLLPAQADQAATKKPIEDPHADLLQEIEDLLQNFINPTPAEQSTPSAEANPVVAYHFAELTQIEAVSSTVTRPVFAEKTNLPEKQKSKPADLSKGISIDLALSQNFFVNKNNMNGDRKRRYEQLDQSSVKQAI